MEYDYLPDNGELHQIKDTENGVLTHIWYTVL